MWCSLASVALRPLEVEEMRAFAGIVAIAVACLLAACGSGSDDSEPLELRSDNAEKGDPQLGPQRIRITPNGLWTPIFWVKLDDLEEGQRVGARVNAQLTACRPSDLSGGSSSSCKGTAPYDFPAKVDWKLILAESAKGSDMPRTSGRTLGKPGSLDCTQALHHCVPVAQGETEIAAADEGNRFVAFVVRATSPKAKPCDPAKPPKCNVLQLTPGQGRLGVLRVLDPGSVPAPDALATEKELSQELKLAESSSAKKNQREVVYSIEVEKPGPLVIDGLLQASYDAKGQPIPPLVSKELVLATSPNSIEGTPVAPQNGENCAGDCRFAQPAVIPCVTQEDIDAGRRYLNFVAFSARESSFAKNSAPVAVRNGGYLRADQYDASLVPDC
jgi:hypothetical protein